MKNFKFSQVIMGGGRDYFTKKGDNSTGKRSDEDLIIKWKNDKQNRFSGKNAKYVTNKEELMNTNMLEVDFVLGINTIYIGKQLLYFVLRIVKIFENVL